MLSTQTPFHIVSEPCVHEDLHISSIFTWTLLTNSYSLQNFDGNDVQRKTSCQRSSASSAYLPLLATSSKGSSVSSREPKSALMKPIIYKPAHHARRKVVDSPARTGFCSNNFEEKLPPPCLQLSCLSHMHHCTNKCKQSFTMQQERLACEIWLTYAQLMWRTAQ